MEETKKNHGMVSVITALIANLVVAVSKFIGYAVSGSAAMLNESIHSVVDCSNQILLLFGDKRANRGRSALHNFGESRAKYFFSTIVATMLFFGGGILGIMEAFEKILHPSHEVSNVLLVIGILIFGLIVESFSLRVALKEIRELNREKLPLRQFLKTSRHSEILIIFTEDFCAVVGLLLALAGTSFTYWTGNAFYDGLSGLLIGIMLLLAALFLAREFYSLLIGESVTESDYRTIETSFQDPAVARIIDIKTVHLSPDEILIAAKLDLNDAFDATSSQIVNQLEATVRTALPHYHLFIYIEIDEFDQNYTRTEK